MPTSEQHPIKQYLTDLVERTRVVLDEAARSGKLPSNDSVVALPSAGVFGINVMELDCDATVQQLGYLEEGSPSVVSLRIEWEEAFGVMTAASATTIANSYVYGVGTVPGLESLASTND